VILVTTDPPEPLVDVTRHCAGDERVLSTSTYLDSLRFRVHLGERLGVSPACRCLCDR
jgi:L-lactate dehydrogenase